MSRTASALLTPNQTPSTPSTPIGPRKSITWRAARHTAGVFLSYAAAPLGLLDAADVIEIEAGRLQPTDWQIKQARAFYHLAPDCELLPVDDDLLDINGNGDGGGSSNSPGNVDGNNHNNRSANANGLSSEFSPDDPRVRSTSLGSTFAYRPEVLREHRKALQLSCADAAQSLHVSAATLNNLERGVATVTANMAARVLRQYGLEEAESQAVAAVDHENPPEGVVILRILRDQKRRNQRGASSRRGQGSIERLVGGRGPVGSQAAHASGVDGSGVADAEHAGGAETTGQPVSPTPTPNPEPPNPNRQIELILSPLDGYLMGRSAADRDALLAMGGELVPAEYLPHFSQMTAVPDAEPIDLNPLAGVPYEGTFTTKRRVLSGLNTAYRTAMLDYLIARGITHSESAAQLVRLVWQQGIPVERAIEMLGLSERTGREYLRTAAKFATQLMERDDVRAVAMGVFREAYGVED